MRKFKDLTGQKIGRWSVLGRVTENEKEVRFYCKCECGTARTVSSRALTTGTSKSCGCLKNEISSQRLKASNYKHGESNTRLFNIWRGMNERCSNKNHIAYKNYGGNNVKVCDEWKESFVTFKNWALINGYEDCLTIDRKNVNGDYEPDNCRFSTLKEQQNNKRNNCVITYNGKTQTAAQWGEEVSIKGSIIALRIKRGWTPEKALTTPVKNRA